MLEISLLKIEKKILPKLILNITSLFIMVFGLIYMLGTNRNSPSSPFYGHFGKTFFFQFGGFWGSAGVAAPHPPPLKSGPDRSVGA